VRCCPLSSGDNDGPSFLYAEIRKAAKTHACCECDETIPAGSKYEYTSGKWDGDVSAYKTCLSCVEIRNHFGERRGPEDYEDDDYFYCTGGWTYTTLWYDLEQGLFPAMTAGGPCFEGLSPAAKNRLFERRMAWLEANPRDAFPRKLYAPKIPRRH
jgi:hypothetical protein